MSAFRFASNRGNLFSASFKGVVSDSEATRCNSLQSLPMSPISPNVKLNIYIVNRSIWMFPKIMVPPNHPFLTGVFHYKPSIWGYPYCWKHPYLSHLIFRCLSSCRFCSSSKTLACSSRFSNFDVTEGPFQTPKKKSLSHKVYVGHRDSVCIQKKACCFVFLRFLEEMDSHTHTHTSAGKKTTKRALILTNNGIDLESG